jgi:hypothetical protein
MIVEALRKTAARSRVIYRLFIPDRRYRVTRRGGILASHHSSS